MSERMIEDELKQLAEGWPGKSVAAEVSSRLDASPMDRSRSKSMAYQPRSSMRVYPLISAIVSAAALILLAVWLLMPRTLHAALQSSIQQSRSGKITTELFQGETTTKEEIWFHRDHGYRMSSSGKVTIDDGKVNTTWSPDDPASFVLVRPSSFRFKMITTMFVTHRMPNEFLNQRSPELDQVVSGVDCHAYLVLQNIQPDQRGIILLDHAERPRQVIRQSSKQGKWETESIVTIDLDQEVLASVFELDIPKNAKRIDVREVFESRFPLSDAVSTKEKDGIIFAVHEFMPIDDGSYYVVSSARGSPEYLKQYPATKRPFNQHYTALDVVKQTHNHSPTDDGVQVLMFNQEWQGVDYLWWIMVPRNAASDVKQTKIQVPLIGNHWSPNRKDKRGVQLQTRINLEVPLATIDRAALTRAIESARRDMSIVSLAFGETTSLPIAASIKGSVQFTSFDKITNEAYAQELLKARWQIQQGDFTGNDPPKNPDGSFVLYPQASPPADEPAKPPAPVLSSEPTPLPETIVGQVVNSFSEPIARAVVSVHIRRFNTDPDRGANDALELEGPGPWSAVTDDKGNYSISPTGTIRPSIDEVRIKVKADNYADGCERDYEKKILKGTLPVLTLQDGRPIRGRLVDPKGNPIVSAVVRFQSNTANFRNSWDSGPFAVDKKGRFSLSVPMDGRTAGAVYPSQFACRFIEITNDEDQGDVVLKKGISLKGRVEDIKGNGVASTVVGIDSKDFINLDGFLVMIKTAVKTDDKGFFQLPNLSGTYILSVANAKPDFSRQLMLIGATPPKIEARTIDTDDLDPSDLIVLEEE